MTVLERREHALSKLPALPSESSEPGLKPGSNSKPCNRGDEALPEASAFNSPEAPYLISDSQNTPLNITRFLSEHVGDPAITVSTLIFNQHTIRLT